MQRSIDATLEALDREKHRNCDRWGHCRPTAEETRENRTMTELAIWLVLGLSALWMLAMLGGVKP